MTTVRIVPSDTAKRVFLTCYECRFDELPRKKFVAALKQWDVRLLQLDGQTFGAIACKDGMFHFGVLPEWRGRWATRSRMRDIVDWVRARNCARTNARSGSMGERLAKAVGMIPSRELVGGQEYVYPSA